jgi:signal peptidase II
MNASTPLTLTRRLAIMLPVVLLFLGLDQWSKSWAVATLEGHPPRTYGTILTLVYAENRGAWGSLGAAWPDSVRWLVLGLLPAVVLLGLAVYALREVEITGWEVAACGLVVAGGVGNLIDRFTLGYVQDFLYLGYGPIGTNIFNVADAVVMLGLGILLLQNLRSQRAEKTPPPPQAV